MPLIQSSDLPSFQRLRDSGVEVLDTQRAAQQDIRELHIGLLNLMPDAALEATERQFFRLVGSCNRIAQFHIHPFTVPGVERGAKAQAHVDAYYQDFAGIREEGLDALIISGANRIILILLRMGFGAAARCDRLDQTRCLFNLSLVPCHACCYTALPQPASGTSATKTLGGLFASCLWYKPPIGQHDQYTL